MSMHAGVRIGFTAALAARNIIVCASLLGENASLTYKCDNDLIVVNVSHDISLFRYRCVTILVGGYMLWLFSLFRNCMFP